MEYQDIMIYVTEKVRHVIQEKKIIRYSSYLFINFDESFFIPRRITPEIKLKPESIINLFYHYRNTSSIYSKRWGTFLIQSCISDDEYEYYINNNLNYIFDYFILNDEYIDCPYILIFMYANGDEFLISRTINCNQDQGRKDVTFEYILFHGKIERRRIIKNNLSEIKPGYLAIVLGKCSIYSREQFLINSVKDLSPDKKSHHISL